MSDAFSQWVEELDSSQRQKIEGLSANSSVVKDVMRRLFTEFDELKDQFYRIFSVAQQQDPVALQIAAMLRRSCDSEMVSLFRDTMKDLLKNNAQLYQEILACIGPHYVFKVRTIVEDE